MPKAGFYAVAKGHVPGIYSSWEDCEDQVKGFPGATYKKLKTLREAEQFVANASGTPGKLENESSTTVPTLAVATKMSQAQVASVSSAAKPDVSIQEAESEEGYDVVYCDGACKGNGQVGSIAGIGVWWGHNDPRNMAERCPGAQTNNRAELIAIVRVLEETSSVVRPLMIKTDSTYSIKCLREWHQNWELRGWKTSSGNPVLNAGIIRYLLALLSLRHLQGSTVKFVYVQGHAGIVGNEGADAQANLGTRFSEIPDRDWDAERIRIEQLISEFTKEVYVLDKAVQVEIPDEDEDEEFWKEACEIDPSSPAAAAPPPTAKEPIVSTAPVSTSATSNTPTSSVKTAQNTVVINGEEYSSDDIPSLEELEAEVAEALR